MAWDTKKVEWPTLGVAACIYLGFGIVTTFHDLLPWWVIIPLAAYLVAWHGSLQHEVVHGHPTPWPAFNCALVFPSLWLWLPYRLYEETHTRHHGIDVLTDPIDDPESFYLTGAKWTQLSSLGRAILAFRNTLLGRFLWAPVESVWCLLRSELALIRARDFSHLPAWGLHVGGCALTLYWVMAVCGIELWAYLLLYAYPALSLTTLRSFLEHQAHPDPDKQTVIVEADPVTSLLFLNNNLHRVHHDDPSVPWYRLPARFRERRSAWLRDGEGYYYPSYLDIAKRYLLRAKEPVVHPAPR